MQKLKLVIIGASGLIGSNVLHAAKKRSEKYEIFGKSRTSREEGVSTIDITDYKALKEFFEREKPDIVLNCAGIAGKVACEKDPEKANAVNLEGAIYLADLCYKNETKLVHLSSVAVHDGKKNEPYTEEDSVSLVPGNLYNIAKALSELAVESTPNSVIVRVGDTYGTAANNSEVLGGSIFKWAYESLKEGKEISAFRGLKSNQTLLSDLGEAVMALVDLDFSGRINIGGEAISVRDFFQEIKDSYYLPGNVAEKDPPEDYQGNKKMDTSKMENLGIKIVRVREGLESLAAQLKIK